MLAEYHDDDHLVKFEELLEAAVDLDKIPDEYLICASYDAGLQVSHCAALVHLLRLLIISRIHLFAGPLYFLFVHRFIHSLIHYHVHYLTLSLTDSLVQLHSCVSRSAVS